MCLTRPDTGGDRAVSAAQIQGLENQKRGPRMLEPCCWLSGMMARSVEGSRLQKEGNKVAVVSGRWRGGRGEEEEVKVVWPGVD